MKSPWSEAGRVGTLSDGAISVPHPEKRQILSRSLIPSLRSTQDSPTNKLLYAKEIPEYRKIVQRYYKQIHDMTPLSEQEMNAHLAEESRVRRAVGSGT